jgi:tRNA threonylcarbamoyladenosine biosynthesis protein TsaE
VVADVSGVAKRLTRDALEARGVAIGRALVAPALVTLQGELGAGKTTLVQAICRGLGVREPVTSPTFALIHEYVGQAARVVHCDLYRLDSARDVASLGLDDFFADAATVVLIEWPERAARILPTPSLVIALAHSADDPEIRLCTEGWAA